MYSIVNVENLKIYEPPIIFDKDQIIQALIVDDFVPKYLDELQEYVTLDKRIRTS